jgi:hypothetical protein
MIGENDLSQHLENARREKERLRQQQLEANERVKRLEREQEQLKRRFNPENDADQS